MVALSLSSDSLLVYAGCCRLLSLGLLVTSLGLSLECVIIRCGLSWIVSDLCWFTLDELSWAFSHHISSSPRASVPACRLSQPVGDWSGPDLNYSKLSHCKSAISIKSTMSNQPSYTITIGYRPDPSAAAIAANAEFFALSRKSAIKYSAEAPAAIF